MEERDDDDDDEEEEDGGDAEEKEVDDDDESFDRSLWRMMRNESSLEMKLTLKLMLM